MNIYIVKRIVEIAQIIWNKCFHDNTSERKRIPILLGNSWYTISCAIL